MPAAHKNCFKDCVGKFAEVAFELIINEGPGSL